MKLILKTEEKKYQKFYSKKENTGDVNSDKR
jgi:hypothetical protein